MSGQVLANPVGECCLRATIHEGEPQGKIVKVLDVDTYVSEPEAGKANGNVVLYFPDVFGFYINSKLLADAFAKDGYLAIAVDYFRGDYISKYLNDGASFDSGMKEGFSFEDWRQKHEAFCKDFVPKWVSEIKATYGKPETKFACTGYCWGAPHVMNQLSAKGICSVGAFAHPAVLSDSHFRDLQKPLFLSCSEIDMTFPTENRRKAVDILMEEKKKFQVQLFQGVSHGFAVKGDMSDPWQKYAKEQSFQGIIDWFDMFLSK